jgi:simple sugar transport system ATP-binding protein
VKQRAEDLVKRFDIRGDRSGLPVSLLSGGNLQRAILAREVSATPKVLLAASPTRGLDVAAIQVIRQLLLDVRDKGAAILMISEDLEEVMALSDEILVMFEGEVIGRLKPDQADPEVIGLLMAGHKSAPV